MFAGVDDELAVRSKHAFAAAKSMLVQLGDGKVSVCGGCGAQATGTELGTQVVVRLF